MQTNHPLYETLAEVVGSKYVTDEKFAAWATYADAGYERGGLAGIIVKPQTTHDVSQVLKIANRTGTPVTIRGGGSGMAGQGTPTIPGGILLDMTDMNKIIEINKDTMVATAQAGVTLGALLTKVRELGLDCCFGGHAVYSATLGGTVSVGCYCVGGAKYGAYHDQVVCLELVLPAGEVIRTGSDATVNGGRFTRYGNGPDLTGMFIGDQGIFGVKTEVSVRLYPQAGAREFETYCFKSLESGSKAIWKLVRTAYVYDGYAVLGNKSVRQVARVNPVIPEGTEMAVMICVEDDPETVGIRKKKLDELAISEGATLVGPEPAKSPTYDIMGDHACKVRSYGVAAPVNGFIPVYKLPVVTRTIEDLLEKHASVIKDIPGTNWKAWLNACFLVKGPCVNYANRITFVDYPPEEREKGLKVWRELVRVANEFGSCPYWIGKTWTPYLAPRYRNTYFVFLKELKKTLDPHNIINPGIIIP